MAPELFYFDGPGRANLTRLAFIVGNVEFTDTRFKFDEWPAVKGDPASVPAQLFGSMPALKDGDTLIGKSCAIAMYAAALGKLAGETAAERALCEMMVTHNEDVRSTLYGCLFGSDESKAAAREALSPKASVLLAEYERAFERQEKKGVKGPFLLGGEQPSVADLAVFDNVCSPFPGFNALGVDVAPFPRVKACADAVGALAEVQAFVTAGFKKSGTKSAPELFYFDAPGRANLARLAFVVGDVEFTDTRWQFPEWPAIKGDPASVPAQLFGSLPALKHGDTLIGKSCAIAMYAAELGKLAGETAAERALCEMMVTHNEDVRSGLFDCLVGSNEKKAAALEAFLPKVPALLAEYERVFERQEKGGVKGPFLLGGERPSVADLAVFDNVGSPFPVPMFDALGVDLAPFPRVKACSDAVGVLAKVQTFVNAGKMTFKLA